MFERTYRIRKAAQLSGVPEALIRAWERRYGLLKPRRSASGYRSYGEEEIEVLRQVKRLTAEGIPVGDAVKQVPRILERIRLPAPVPSPQLASASVVDVWKARVLEGAETFNQPAVEQVLDEALASVSALAAYEQLVIPSLREVGRRWQEGQLCVVQEHLVTQAFRTRLLGLLHLGMKDGRNGHAVCACLMEEHHELGLIGAALKLQHFGYRITYLGARTPPRELALVVAGSQADLVALSLIRVEGRREFRAALEAAIQGLPRSVRVIVGGAAAHAYADVCEELHVMRMVDEDDWQKLRTSGSRAR